MRQYYAAYRPYGVRSLNVAGLRADRLVAFVSRDERDAWVARDDERREPLPAAHIDVRAARRYETRDGYRVIVSADELALA